jgi:hypothetical protein
MGSPEGLRHCLLGRMHLCRHARKARLHQKCSWCMHTTWPAQESSRTRPARTEIALQDRCPVEDVLVWHSPGDSLPVSCSERSRVSAPCSKDVTVHPHWTRARPAVHVLSPTASGSYCPAREDSAPQCGTEFFIAACPWTPETDSMLGLFLTTVA